MQDGQSLVGVTCFVSTMYFNLGPLFVPRRKMEVLKVIKTSAILMLTDGLEHQVRITNIKGRLPSTQIRNITHVRGDMRIELGRYFFKQSIVLIGSARLRRFTVYAGHHSRKGRNIGVQRSMSHGYRPGG